MVAISKPQNENLQKVLFISKPPVKVIWSFAKSFVE